MTIIEGFQKAAELGLKLAIAAPTKAALQNAGTEPWSIYARDELRILCEQNRIAPISNAELRKLHEIKRTFNAKITSEDLK
jgi:hypothetical protein